jgi:hypothetical protein
LSGLVGVVTLEKSFFFERLRLDVSAGPLMATRWRWDGKEGGLSGVYTVDWLVGASEVLRASQKLRPLRSLKIISPRE